MVITVCAGEAEARPKTPSEISHKRVSGPKQLGHLTLLFQEKQQGADRELEHPELELKFI